MAQSALLRRTRATARQAATGDSGGETVLLGGGLLKAHLTLAFSSGVYLPARGKPILAAQFFVLFIFAVQK
jgi:hypothetical protein